MAKAVNQEIIISGKEYGIENPIAFSGTSIWHNIELSGL